LADVVFYETSSQKKKLLSPGLFFWRRAVNEETLIRLPKWVNTKTFSPIEGVSKKWDILVVSRLIPYYKNFTALGPLSHHPIMQGMKIDKEKADLFVEEVKSQSLLPEFKLSGETGLVPEARGDIFDSPDKQTDLDGWGPFYKLNVQLVQPLLTFGRKSSALAAAYRGTDLQYLKNNSEIEELILNVINSYWALSAAKKAESIAEDLKKNYDKMLKEVKERLESDDSEVDDTDCLEVKSNQYHIEEIYIKSKSENNLAQKVFNAAIGRNLVEPVKIAEEKCPKIDLHENQIHILVKQTFPQHMDTQRLKTTVKLFYEKKKLANSQKNPFIYLVGGFGVAHASHRQGQANPFAVDNFNYLDLGAFLGFQWDLNFFRKNFEAKRFQLDIESMEKKLDLLRVKVELEVVKAFAEVKKNATLLNHAQHSLKAAKNWLRLGMDNWDLGIGEVERLIKAYNAYYQMKGIVIKRTLELNTSLANFAFILGNTRLYLDWVKNGTVKVF